MPLSSSVTVDKTSPLERSGGRVHLIQGHFFYSPNSQRNVQLPPVYDDIPYRSCFEDNFAEFRQPLWWQPACPYLAFIPLRPSFTGVPFQDLFHISYFPRLRYGGFMIDPQIILGWARLEKDIRDAVDVLLDHERASKIAWLVPTTLGCQGVFMRVHILRTQYKNSKEWFSLLMGALSYAIAVSITHRQEIFDEAMPHWFSFLSQRDFSQIWLSGIRSSMVADFDSCIDRVGVFVQLFQRHRDQFSVDWLCEFGVPVWYPWGDQEIRASQTDARLARFAPLPYQLQEISTFLTKNPTPQSQPQPITELQTQSTTEPLTRAFDCKLFVSYFTHWHLYSFSFRCCNFCYNPFLESLF
jgi:hypothetical protein